MTEPTRPSQNIMVDSDAVMVDQVFIGELYLQIDNNSGATTSEIAAELDDMIAEEAPHLGAEERWRVREIIIETLQFRDGPELEVVDEL